MGFGGTVYPIHPRHARIRKHRTYQALEDVPGPVDVALMLVNPVRVPSLLRAASGSKAVPAWAVVPGAPVGMTRADLTAWETDLLTAAGESGTRIVGPNCVGVLSPINRSSAAISSALKSGLPARGPVAVVSQTGGLLGGVMSLGEKYGVGFSHLASTGNELDVTIVDFVDFLAGDPSTLVICLIAEGIPDVPRFVDRALDARRSGKSVVLLKLGRSDVGAMAATSHSGRIVPPHGIHSAVVASAGVIQVESIEEMLSAAAALAAYPEGSARPFAMVSRSGGACSYVADRAASLGVPLASLRPATERSLQTMVGRDVPTNPIDLGAGDTTSADGPEMVRAALEVLGEDDGVGVRVMADSVLLPMRELARSTASVSRAKSPLLVGWFAGGLADEPVAILRRAGIPVLRGVDDLLVAIRALGDRGAPLVDRREDTGHLDEQLAAIRARLLRSAGHWTDADALASLAAAGVPIAPSRDCGSPSEAVDVAESLGYPVAVKGMSRDVAHKKDIGAVQLNLIDSDGVWAAARDVLAAMDAAGARSPRVLVQAMAKPGVELAFGCQLDERYGPVVSVQRGGLDIEVDPDTSARPVPITRGVALEMLRDLRMWPLLDGHRGGERLAVDRLVDALVAFGRLMPALHGLVAEVDVNPIVVNTTDVVAVDALFVGPNVGSRMPGDP